MNEKPIPNFYAQTTKPKLVKEIFKKNLGIKEALSHFKQFREEECSLLLTVSVVTERLILFDKSQEMPEEWFLPDVKVHMKAFCLGAVGGQKNAKVINASNCSKITTESKREGWIRDLLCYDGNAYETDQKVTAILVVCVVTRSGGITEVIATIYNIGNTSSLPRTLIDLDIFYSAACEDAREDAYLFGVRRTDVDVCMSAEVRRRN